MGVSELVDSWVIALKSERKSANTIASYLMGVGLYLRWCEENGLPDEVSRRPVQTWVTGLLDSGAEPSTARTRLGAVKQFSRWLTDEGEIDTDELIGLKPPKADIPVFEPLTEEEMQAMLAQCDRKTFMGKRDEAILRIMFECIVRPGDVVNLELDDVDPKTGSGIIRRSKGGKGRLLSFGAKTAAALDRYLRVRRTHPFAHSKQLWLGAQMREGFGYRALHKRLSDIAKAAGVEEGKFHPHLTRHTSATRWLEKGGSEGGLMAAAGWSSRAMLDRYTRATAQQRAAVEHRALDLGDL